MSHQPHTATRRGARRTIVLIAMLTAALLAPSAAAANRQKFLPTGMRPIESKVLLRGADKNGTLHVVVTLRTPGIGAPRSAGGAAQPFALQVAQIRERISARAAVTALGGTVNAEFRYLFNGLRIHIPATQLEALRANPHIADVQLVTRYKRMTVTGGAVSDRGGVAPSNGGAATEVQAKNVWAQTKKSKAGTGDGVKVAVIDTGIDYTHDDFVRNGDVTFPTAKVVAGYDLVGDDYAPGEGGYSEIPVPDSDPLDCSIANGGGHGTHVAGTIAGYGIKSNGDTYGISPSERYTATLNTSTFILAPGMAPLASLIAIRVFGCDGATELTADGIEKAVALGANVINLSLGSPYGIKGGAEQAAINAAEKAGVTVVIAGGNEGSEPFLVGSPSTEDGAISVAALDDRASYPGAKLTFGSAVLGGADPVAFSNTNVFDLTSPTVAAPIKSLFTIADPAAYSLGCPTVGDDGTSYGPLLWDDTADLAGKIVVLRRGTCTFKEKVDAMIAEGAVGVIILQSTSVLSTDQASYPSFQGPNTPTALIPVLMLNGAGETALAAALTDATTPLEGANVSISALSAGIANPNYHTVAEFSSGGPRWGDLALKPELAAPGVDIVSAASGSTDGVAWFSGTSMATPVVAGVAALVKQANPKWTPALIKSALINTAKSVGSEIPLRSVGAGRVNALNAVKAKVTIDAGPNATMSFGMVYGDASAVITKSQTFKLTNSGTSSVTYKFTAASAAGYTLPYGVTFRVYEGSTLLTSSRGVTVAKGKTKTLTVKLSATVNGQKRFSPQWDSPDEGIETGVGGGINLVITGTASGKPSLRLPVIAFLRHVERFSFVERIDGLNSILDGAITTGANDAQTLTGTPREVGAYAFSWAARDGREGIGSGADIKNIGFNAQIGEDWLTEGTGKLSLIITSWDQIWNAALNEYDINLDTNLDGVDDQVVVLADNGWVTTGSADGTVGCFYVDTLNWLDGGAGELYPLGDDCEVYASPGSSAIEVQLEAYLLWDNTNTHGVSFNVTSYNGGGWDSDQTEQVKISFVEIATGTTYASNMDPYLGSGEYGWMPFDGTTSSIVVPYAGFGDSGWGSNTLGWLMWNEFSSGPATEVYEVIAGY
jgi:minor extracellular serine protease Vpr